MPVSQSTRTSLPDTEGYFGPDTEGSESDSDASAPVQRSVSPIKENAPTGTTPGVMHDMPITDHAQNQMQRFQLAHLLIKFIFQFDQDTTALDLLADEWTHNKEHYRSTTRDLYEPFDAAFFEWLTLQQAIIGLKSYRPLSELTLKEKGQRMLARNQLRAQHCRWSGLKYSIHGKVLEGVQVLSLMLCNVAVMSGAEDRATCEDGLRGMDESIKSLLEG